MGVIPITNLIAGATRYAPGAGGSTVDSAAAGPGMLTARALYDFAVDGGAVSAIALLPSTDLIPLGAVILGGYIDVQTVPTSSSSTATIAVGVEAATDLQAAAVISGAPWSTTGRKSITPVFTGASSVKTTAARNITATVAVQALTAGKFEVVLFYLVP